MALYIIPPRSEITDEVRTAAAGAPIARGIPPRLRGQLAGIELPYLYDPPDDLDRSTITLDDAKGIARARIDAILERRIAAGFQAAGQRFGLSLAERQAMVEAYALRATLTYPVRWRTIDDSAGVSIGTAVAMGSFVEAGLGAVATRTAAANAAKAAVDAAATLAAVKAAFVAYRDP